METPNWLKKLEKHPFVEKIIKDEADKTNNTRRLAIEEIQKIDEIVARTESDYDAEVKKVFKVVVGLREQLKAAEKQYCKLMGSRHNFSVDMEINKKRHLTLLLESYPNEIDVFIHDMQTRLYKNQEKANSVSAGKGRRDLYTEQRDEYINTNCPAIKEANEYICSAIREAEKLKLIDLTDYDLDGQLAALKDGIPSIDEYTTIIRSPADISALKQPSWFDPNWSHPQQQSGWVKKPY